METIRRTRIALALATCIMLASFALLAGCANTQGQPPADPSSGSEVTLDAEGVMQIPLEYNAGTGYQWTCTLEPETGVAFIAYEYDEDLSEGELVEGGPLRHWVTLRAAAPGEVTLTCTLERPWQEGEPDSVQVYAFTVASNLQFYLDEDKSDYVLEPVRSYNS